MHGKNSYSQQFYILFMLKFKLISFAYLKMHYILIDKTKSVYSNTWHIAVIVFMKCIHCIFTCNFVFLDPELWKNLWSRTKVCRDFVDEF